MGPAGTAPRVGSARISRLGVQKLFFLTVLEKSRIGIRGVFAVFFSSIMHIQNNKHYINDGNELYLPLVNNIASK